MKLPKGCYPLEGFEDRLSRTVRLTYQNRARGGVMILCDACGEEPRGHFHPFIGLNFCGCPVVASRRYGVWVTAILVSLGFRTTVADRDERAAAALAYWFERLVLMGKIRAVLYPAFWMPLVDPLQAFEPNAVVVYLPVLASDSSYFQKLPCYVEEGSIPPPV